MEKEKGAACGMPNKMPTPQKNRVVSWPLGLSVRHPEVIDGSLRADKHRNSWFFYSISLALPKTRSWTNSTL
jgi:hypothetical protein